VEGGDRDCEERETEREREDGEAEIEVLWVLGVHSTLEMRRL
jgi:hypothetical protein